MTEGGSIPPPAAMEDTKILTSEERERIIEDINRRIAAAVNEHIDERVSAIDADLKSEQQHRTRREYWHQYYADNKELFKAKARERYVRKCKTKYGEKTDVRRNKKK